MNLEYFITPALIISAIAYITLFFGRVIEDQIPFSDNRKWSIELNGLFFMANVIWFGLLGVIFAINYPLPTAWLNLITYITLSLILTSLYIKILHEGRKFFNIRFEIAKFMDEKLGDSIKISLSLSKIFSSGISVIIIFYLSTQEFISGNLLGIAFSCLMTFFILFFLAIITSFSKIKYIIPANIHFSDQNKLPILNATILKVNDDNIRLRVENTILILNKNEVSKIEMQLPPEMI